MLCLAIARKSVVVHFQGRAFNFGSVPHLADAGRGPTDKELQLGRANHHRIRKCVKTMYVPESIYPATKGAKYHPKFTSRI
jgi:hypothetical protein